MQEHPVSRLLIPLLTAAGGFGLGLALPNIEPGPTTQSASDAEALTPRPGPDFAQILEQLQALQGSIEALEGRVDSLRRPPERQPVSRRSSGSALDENPAPAPAAPRSWEDLNASILSLREAVASLPPPRPSSYPPRGATAHANLLTSFGIRNRLQLSFESISREGDSLVAEHYGLTSTELAERYGHPSEWTRLQTGDVTWEYSMELDSPPGWAHPDAFDEWEPEDTWSIEVDFKLSEGVVIESEWNW